jgi:hypothetical protein
MIWLTWRQHRRDALFALGGLVVLGAFMIISGLAMRDAFDDSGLSKCVAAGDPGPTSGAGESCHRAVNQFYDQFETLSMAGILFLVLPLLVGLFWGAPLVAREVEQGTHRFVWTQGVSRRRWALVKFGIVGAAAVLVSVAYGLGVSWWLTPLNEGGRQGRFDQFFFDMQGVVPIGYTLFAVALGVFAGTVWPRTLPAMAGTLVGFLGLRVALAALARPRYLPARELTYPVQGEAPTTTGGDWVLSSGVRDASGKLVAPNAEVVCPPGAAGPDGRACGADLGLGPGAYNWQLYQPESRFWLFQAIEAGIFVALAALLLLLAVRRIRRIA